MFIKLRKLMNNLSYTTIPSLVKPTTHHILNKFIKNACFTCILIILIFVIVLNYNIYLLKKSK